jgi:hypothetical protein
MSSTTHILSCHCDNIRIEVNAELKDLMECNCSTCGRHGFLHWKVPASAVRLLTQSKMLSTYYWRDASGGHVFCPICGTGLLRPGYPGDRVSVNARCIEGIDIFALAIARYDGRTDMPPGPTK